MSFKNIKKDSTIHLAIYKNARSGKYNFHNIQPKKRALKFDEILEFHEELQSEIVPKVNTNYFIAKKHHAPAPDPRAIDLDLERDQIKSVTLQSINPVKSNKVAETLSGFNLPAQIENSTSSITVGKAVFTNKKRGSISEARIRTINFKKRIQAHNSAYPMKGVSDRDFIKK